MHPGFTSSLTLVNLCGKAIPGAEDRQKKIPGFDQRVFSQSHVLCIGSGGIISMIAPTLVRKGIGRITLLDDDVVEESNLNRQRFYIKDVGQNKALALAANPKIDSLKPIAAPIAPKNTAPTTNAISPCLQSLAKSLRV